LSATFETFFSLGEIAQRIPKSDKFWRAELKRGAFGPGCVLIGGEYFVPVSAVAAYLERHGIGARPLAELVNGRTRQALPAPAALSAGTAARSAGELRRKLAPLEVANG
jgi:hypothetical protein